MFIQVENGRDTYIINTDHISWIGAYTDGAGQPTMTIIMHDNQRIPVSGERYVKRLMRMLKVLQYELLTNPDEDMWDYPPAGITPPN